MEEKIEFEPEFEKMLQNGAPFVLQRSINTPILVPPSIITNTNISRHLLGVYVSMLYMYDRGVEDIRLLGMEEKRFESNIQELVELGLVKIEEDGTLKLLEVC